MTPDDVGRLLAHGLTQYDAAQEAKANKSRRAYYNHYALGQYLIRVDEVVADIKDGADIREAVTAAFTGAVLKAALKSLNLDKASTDELTGAGKGLFYRKVSDK